MATKPSRPSPEVIESIKHNAARVREAADEMTKRIEQFETYLGSLKGRIDTMHFGTHPDATPPQYELELGIRLHRKDKAWVLSWSEYHPSFHEEHGMEWKPLKEASLKIKIAAMKMFPDLLEAIEKSQIQLVEEIEGATADFDTFAKTFKANGRERA